MAAEGRSRVYGEAEDGKWEEIDVWPLHLACCDCSLVHKIWIRINKKTGKYQLKFKRDNRATAQLRRHHPPELP